MMIQRKKLFETVLQKVTDTIEKDEDIKEIYQLAKMDSKQVKKESLVLMGH